MKEVALELEGLLRATDMHPWMIQDSNNFRETEYLLGDSHVGSAETGPVSTTGSENTIKNQLLPFHIAESR